MMFIIDIINTVAEGLGLFIVWGGIASFVGYGLLGLFEGVTGGWWGK